MARQVRRKHSRYQQRKVVISISQRPRRRHRPQKKRKQQRKQHGGFKFSSLISRLPFELHMPGYNFCGPGTRLTKRLHRGDQGINRLDEICKAHDIAYSQARNQRDYAEADRVMINAIDMLPNKSLIEKIVRGVIAAKRWIEK